MSYTFDREKTVCFSGHRPERLPQNGVGKDFSDLLCKEIDLAVCDGYTDFIHGGCYGFDLIAAQEVLNMRSFYEHGIRLHIAVPFEGQETKWSRQNINEYQAIRAISDSETIISPTYYKGCYYKRNRFLVENSSRLICYCTGGGGTGYTMNYALKKGLDVRNLADPHGGNLKWEF